MIPMFKSNKGFTLVELIVVIAILAILAGIAVPAYSGYIKKANEAADITQLDAIKTAAVFAYTEDNISTGNTDVTVIYVDDATGTVYVNGEENTNVVDVSSYVTINDFKSDTFANGAQWSSSTSTWTAWTPS